MNADRAADIDQSWFFADNTFIGRNDPNHLIGWSGDFWAKFNGVEGQSFPPRMASYVAVKLYGPGHVVAYNYIADFHDGINVETYGNPDGSSASGPGIIEGPRYPAREYWDRRPVAIDFYNNYITNSHDNPIEADGSMHNVRILPQTCSSTIRRTPSATSLHWAGPSTGFATLHITSPEVPRD